MDLSGFVDIGLALVTVYLLLSLLASTINEIINSIWKIRAEQLAKTLEGLLDSDDLHQKFLGHGLIGGLGRSSRAGAETGKAPRPSYIDSKTFADALFGVLANLDPTQPVKVPVLEDIQSAVQALQPGTTRDALLAALTVANGDITRLRDGVAAWFDASMDRLSGAFVRQMKVISLIVGLILACALNVDSVDIAYRAWNDPQVRAAISDTADKLNKNPPAQCAEGDADTKLPCELGKVGDLLELLRPLPVGWGAGSVPSVKVTTIVDDKAVETVKYTAGFWWYFWKVIGLIVTGLAVSLGAPFWFDILQKVMNIRGAGTKPAETPAPQ
jgi:hypothetical protein